MRVRSGLVACALACVCVAAAPRGAGAPQPLTLTAAHGALALVGPTAGTAILVARNLRPGETQTGSVTVANRGRARARLYLLSSTPRERPGRNGGSLGARLALRIDGGGQALAGSPSSLAGCHDLGVIGGGARRAYTFTVTLPDGGRPRSATGGDNAYAGSAASVDEAWFETPPRAGGCTPAPAPQITVRGVPRACARGDFELSVRVRSRAPLTRTSVRLDRWTLLATSRARRELRLRLRVSDDWLIRRHNPLVVTAANRAGGRAVNRRDVGHCFPRRRRFGPGVWW